MFGSSSRRLGSSSSPASSKYSLQGLRQVYTELLAYMGEARSAAALSDAGLGGGGSSIISRGSIGSSTSHHSQQHCFPSPARRDALVELIRSVSEIIIYGEQHTEQELIFDYFCEKNMLALLTDMMRASWSDEVVQTQVIQTIAILVQNVRNETSLYYLLSNNYVNEIIMLELNFGDSDLVSQFVSFLKTLSLRLNVRTVQFFLDDRAGSMPLYDCVLNFINQGENMVRTSALTIVLNLFRVDDAGLRAFLLRADKQHDFFRQISQLLQNQTSQLLGYVLTATVNAQSGNSGVGTGSSRSDRGGEGGAGGSTAAAAAAAMLFDQRGNMDETIASFQDQLFYLQDVFDLGIETLSENMGDHFIAAYVRPNLFEPLATWYTNTVLAPVALPTAALATAAGAQAEGTEAVAVPFDFEAFAPAATALFALAQVFLSVRDRRIVGALLAELFDSGSGPSLGGSLLVNAGSERGKDEDPVQAAAVAGEAAAASAAAVKSAPSSSPLSSEGHPLLLRPAPLSGGRAPKRARGVYRAAFFACLRREYLATPVPLLAGTVLEAVARSGGADRRLLEALELIPPIRGLRRANRLLNIITIGDGGGGGGGSGGGDDGLFADVSGSGGGGGAAEPSSPRRTHASPKDLFGDDDENENDEGEGEEEGDSDDRDDTGGVVAALIDNGKGAVLGATAASQEVVAKQGDDITPPSVCSGGTPGAAHDGDELNEDSGTRINRRNNRRNTSDRGDDNDDDDVDDDGGGGGGGGGETKDYRASLVMDGHSDSAVFAFADAAVATEENMERQTAATTTDAEADTEASNGEEMEDNGGEESMLPDTPLRGKRAIPTQKKRNISTAANGGTVSPKPQRRQGALRTRTVPSSPSSLSSSFAEEAELISCIGALIADACGPPMIVEPINDAEDADRSSRSSGDTTRNRASIDMSPVTAAKLLSSTSSSATDRGGMEDDERPEFTVGAVKLLGRLLCVIHGCGDDFADYTTSYTDSYGGSGGGVGGGSEFKYAAGSKQMEVGELLEATLRDAHSRTVVGLREAFDARSNPLGDAVLELVEGEVVTAILTHRKRAGLPLLVPRPAPLQTLAETSRLLTANSPQKDSSAGASAIAPAAVVTTPTPQSAKALTAEKGEGTLTTPRRTPTASSGSGSNNPNNALRTAPTAWFNAVQRALRPAHGPFEAPALKALTDRCLLLLPHAYLELDGSYPQPRHFAHLVEGGGESGGSGKASSRSPIKTSSFNLSSSSGSSNTGSEGSGGGSGIDHRHHHHHHHHHHHLASVSSSTSSLTYPSAVDLASIARPGGDFARPSVGGRHGDPVEWTRRRVRLFLAVSELCSTLLGHHYRSCANRALKEQHREQQQLSSSESSSSETLAAAAVAKLSPPQRQESDREKQWHLEQQHVWYRRLFDASSLEAVCGGVGSPIMASTVIEQTSMPLGGRTIFACTVESGGSSGSTSKKSKLSDSARALYGKVSCVRKSLALFLFLTSLFSLILRHYVSPQCTILPAVPFSPRSRRSRSGS